jgi:hypothetical protein
MQCILYKIYFWKVFHMYYKLIWLLYGLLCGQNFILVKSGCYKEPEPNAFGNNVRDAFFPKHFRVPNNVIKYDGKTNPSIWLED